MQPVYDQLATDSMFILATQFEIESLKYWNGCILNSPTAHFHPETPGFGGLKTPGFGVEKCPGSPAPRGSPNPGVESLVIVRR